MRSLYGQEYVCTDTRPPRCIASVNTNRNVPFISVETPMPTVSHGWGHRLVYDRRSPNKDSHRNRKRHLQSCVIESAQA